MKFSTVLTIFFYLIFSLDLKADNHSVLSISDNDFYIGSPDAPVTIIEYASMSCSHCADFHNNTLDDLKSEYIDTGKVRFIFRDFPFADIDRNRIFADYISWIEQTLDILKFSKEDWLLRLHPSYKRWGENQHTTLNKIILRNFNGELPKNIRIEELIKLN